MQVYRLGPRALRVYETLRRQIADGSLPPGTQLPSIPALAAEFGVAPLTVRQVHARLEEEGLLSRERGRGTFVQARRADGVLIVEDDGLTRTLLADYVARLGYRAVEAADPVQGMAALQNDSAIVVVFSDIRMPGPRDGITFIRAVRRRWPDLPLVAVTGYPNDLVELHGPSECPVLVLIKPVHLQQIEEALSLASGRSQGRRARAPVLIASDDADRRTSLREIVMHAGHDVREAASTEEALLVLGEDYFGHVFVGMSGPGVGAGLVSTIAEASPATSVVIFLPVPEEVSLLRQPCALLPDPSDEDQVLLALTLRKDSRPPG